MSAYALVVPPAFLTVCLHRLLQCSPTDPSASLILTTLFLRKKSSKGPSCHSGESRNPEILTSFWTPAFAGVTAFESLYNSIVGGAFLKKFCSLRLQRISQILLSAIVVSLVKRTHPAASVMCLSPVISSAQTHLTSELLRFL